MYIYIYIYIYIYVYIYTYIDIYIYVGSRFGHAMCSISKDINKIILEKNSKNEEDFKGGFLVFGGVNEEKDHDDVWLIYR
jgi:hypothetical protein